ncbi:hypothetical protein C1H46_040493 [Malus baccata]|uniref:Neprosin PEP catalytic domain-containing protein n=1 Tax=Malus baccata TaxID=106549 RepID=A0A540KIC9_MALBA|nr:hypothetical protein C1H46_040493 [Malus baccata]
MGTTTTLGGRNKREKHLSLVLLLKHFFLISIFFQNFSLSVEAAYSGKLKYTRHNKQVSSLRLERIEKHLNKINKPAVMTIQSPDGDIIDCVHKRKQPALDHPLLKNHKIQDPKLGNWWMGFGDNTLVGYWPAELFTHLADKATMVEWGGEIVNSRANGEHTATQMGSGHFAEDGFGKASYFRNLEIVDSDNSLSSLKVESFNKLLAEVKAVARDRDEELDLLQKRVVIDLVEFERKAAKKFREAKERKATSAYYDEEKPASVSHHQKDRKLDYRSSSRSRKDEYEYYKDCDEDLEEQPRMSMKKKKKQNPAKKVASTKPSAPSIPSPIQELPNEFKEKIASLHGYQVQLVIQKQLFKTDLSSGHDRLSMPVNQGGWKSISRDEGVGFKIGDTIQVWFFRVNDLNLANKDSIHFAVVRLKKDVNAIDRQEVAESSMTEKNEEWKKDTNGCSNSSSVSARQPGSN